MKTGQRRSVLGDVCIAEGDHEITFGNGALELRISRRTGNWIALREQTTGLTIAGDEDVPTILVRHGGSHAEPRQVRDDRLARLVGEHTVGRHARYESHRVVCGMRDATLEVLSREDEWTITSRLTLAPGTAVLTRSFAIAHWASAEVLVRDARMVVPATRLADPARTTVEAPGYPVRCHTPLEELPEGIWAGLDSQYAGQSGHVQHAADAPGSVPGMMTLRDADVPVALMTWVRSVEEPCMLECERRGEALHVSGWVQCAARVSACTVLESGTQYVAVRHEPWQAALQ